MTSPPIAVRREGHIAVVEMRRPPHNFFDLPLLQAMADAFAALQADPTCRAIVMSAEGRSFCAGADFGRPALGAERVPASLLYEQAVRLFGVTKPVVAAVQGPAIGGGLGLALVADFRVACAEARFSANFTRLGFHPGFGLSHTLPRLVGPQQAGLLLLTGRRIDGVEALRIGLVDRLVPMLDVGAAALQLAHEIAASAPIAVQATRASLRAGLVDAVREATRREAALQAEHFTTLDFAEGVAAMAARREPVFEGR